MYFAEDRKLTQNIPTKMELWVHKNASDISIASKKGYSDIFLQIHRYLLDALQPRMVALYHLFSEFRVFLSVMKFICQKNTYNSK